MGEFAAEVHVPIYPVNENIYVETISESVVGEVTFEFPSLNNMDKTGIKNEEVQLKHTQDITYEKPTESGIDKNDGEKKDQASRLFEERQKRFLYGRKISCDIIDDGGVILIPKDTVIDEYVISVLKEKDKMVELIMNNTRQ